MNTKGIKFAIRLSPGPSSIMATAPATLIFVLAGAATAAEADNRVTILQLSQPAGSENSVLSIVQQGSGNFVGGETQIEDLARSFTTYFLRDVNADGDFNDLVFLEPCGEGCTNFRFIQRESENLAFDLNGDGDTTDPGESGDLDGDAGNDALFYVTYDEANVPTLTFVPDNDPKLAAERFAEPWLRNATAFNGSDVDGRATMTGQGLEVGVVQIGDNNQSALNLNAEQGQVEIGLFGNDNTSAVRIGSESTQSLSEARITAFGNSNAIATKIGEASTSIPSDRTVVEIQLDGDDSTLSTQNEGVDSTTRVRGELSQSVLDLEQRGDGNFVQLDFESDSGTASGIQLLLRQTAFDENDLPIAGGGLQNHIELFWRHGSDSTFILQQFGDGHFMKVENVDAGTTGSTIDITQQGAAQDLNLTLRGGNQVINVDQQPGG